MPSHFACLGFVRDPLDEDELFALLERAFHLSRRLGVGLDGAHVHRWAGEDGSVLVVEVDGDGGVVGVTPSLVGRPGARLAGLRRLGVDVVSATALGPDGEPVADLLVDLEERRFLGAHEGAVDVSVVALGRDVAVAAPDDAPEERTVHSYGAAQAGPDVPQQDAARARMVGTVLAVDERRNELTGLPYRVARVRTVLGDVDVALADPGPRPGAGDVLAGEVYLVGSAPALLPS